MVRPLTAFFGVAALALGALSPSAVLAENAPETPSYASHEETIHGRIADFDGKYELKVRDDRGYVDSVRMHDGTIINPTGLRLASGLSVTILGHGDGTVFQANEIDTPYSQDPGPAYAPAYASEVFATPAYGYYGYGCCYGYGYGYGAPYSFGLAFGYGYPYYGGGYYGGGYGGYYGHGDYGHEGYGHGGYGNGGYNHGGYGGGYGNGGGYQYGHGYNPTSGDRRYLTGGSRSYAPSGAQHYSAPRSSGGGAPSRGTFSNGGSRSHI